MSRDLVLYFAFLFAASFVPLPLAPATLLAAKAAHPWALGLIAATATAIAAVVDYFLVRKGFQLRRLVELRQTRVFRKAEAWSKVAPFVTTGLFAGFPLPFIVVRILMPLSGYPVL